MLTQQQSYFAHLPIIACGERRSLFFFNAAKSPDFVTNNSTVHVKMPPSLVPHFSKLLNYLYDNAFVLSTENVVCLIMFSLNFEMPKLEISVNEFIAKYVNPNNATTYLMCIIELQQEDPNGNGQYNAAIEECKEILVFNIK